MKMCCFVYNHYLVALEITTIPLTIDMITLRKAAQKYLADLHKYFILKNRSCVKKTDERIIRISFQAFSL